MIVWEAEMMALIWESQVGRSYSGEANQKEAKMIDLELKSSAAAKLWAARTVGS